MTHPDIRIALVTGANKGIGLEIARQLGMQGMRVLVGARDQDRGQAAAAALAHEGISARDVQLDLTEPATIGSAAADIEAREGRLDILINNAGITSSGDGSPGTADLEAVRRTFDTNFFGTLAVTQAMLPLLKRSPSGRIVNVSSGLGSLAYNSDPNSEYAAYRFIGYNTSKAALNMLTVQLAAELKDLGIKVNSADPGYTATDLNRHRGRHHTGGSGGSRPFGPAAGRRAHGRVLRCRWSPALIGREQAGARPSHSRHCAPSMTYSMPVIDAARGDTKKAMRSATSFGLAGPPLECRRGCRHKVLVDLLPPFGVVESAAKPPPGA
jgi:NAD(P)-dependent dehydrogenase (short-subunit alcohol dehydrogenase family)